MDTEQEIKSAAETLGRKGGKSKSVAKLAGLAKARAQREANVKARKATEALQLGTLGASTLV